MSTQTNANGANGAAPWFDFSHIKGDVFGGLTAIIVALQAAYAFSCYRD